LGAWLCWGGLVVQAMGAWLPRGGFARPVVEGWGGAWMQGAIGVSLQEGIGKRPGSGGTSVQSRCISGIGGRGSCGVELVGTGY